jgi:predicted nucleic-acid-binding protein
MTALLCLPGVRVAMREVLLHALELYGTSNADFVDCFLAARSDQRKIPVVTFDETDFRKLAVRWEKP